MTKKLRFRMNCPNCERRLKCQDSRPMTHDSIRREYGCPGCLKVFASIEQLDNEPVDKVIRPSEIEYLEKRLKHGQSIRGKQELT
jgi:transcriptional regulator NrdR family protein